MRNWRSTRTSCTNISGFKTDGRGMMRLAGFAVFAAALTLSAAAPMEMARAQISDDTVKIGVMNDMSGLYADISGQGSVEAARMAIADFGGTVNGKKI